LIALDLFPFVDFQLDFVVPIISSRLLFFLVTLPIVVLDVQCAFSILLDLRSIAFLLSSMDVRR